MGRRLMRWLRTDQVGVGLDIGTSSVKVVMLAQQDDGYALLGASLVSLGERSDSATADAIGWAMTEAHAQGRPVATALSAAVAAIRLMEIPFVPEDDLYSIVPYRAQEEMAYDARRSRLDFAVVSRSERQLRVLTVAASIASIEHIIGLVRRAGASVAAIDVDALAVVNCFLGLGLAASGAWARGTIGLLYVGASTTALAVLSGGQLEYHREIAMGTDAMEERRQMIEEFAGEIRLSLEYHEDQTGRTVRCLLFGGGGVLHPLTSEVLERVLHVPVLPWDPTDAMTVPESLRERVGPMASQLTVAIGLALRGVCTE